jgi:hypothetical protein
LLTQVCGNVQAATQTGGTKPEGPQHPPLQTVSAAAPQLVVQRCVVVLQECWTGQSVATVHPHAPPTQAEPLAFPVQFRQLAPQDVGSVSTWQMAVTVEQQVPPPHAPSPPDPHAEVHVLLEPHVGVAPEQDVHGPPPVPQSPLAVPGAQLLGAVVAGGQHPPLHNVSPA